MKVDILNMLNEMSKSIDSIKEDINYGATLDEVPSHNFINAEEELDLMENRLMKISEDVAMQLILSEQIG